MTDQKDFFSWAPPEPEGEVVEAEFTVEEDPLPPMVISDTRIAYVKLEQFKQGVELLRQQAKAVTLIRDEATAKNAVAMASTAKKKFKELEDIRHHFVDPLWDAKKQIDGWFKEFTEPLGAIEKYLAKLIGNFRQFQETERRRVQAEQEAAARKVREEQEKEAAKAKEKGIQYEVAPTPAPVAPEVQKVIRTSEGSASQRKVQKLVVEDEKLIPEEYWIRTLDEAKLLQDLKAGVTVPGARIEDEFITNIRC
jgi:hypothetical protein